MQNLSAIIMISVLALSITQTAYGTESKLEHNKRIVREFYDLAFNQHHPLEAANKYLAVNYVQHNPHVADGRQGFIDAFSHSTKPDTSTTNFKRFIAEGDLVVIHSHGRDTPEDRGVAVVDIFRVKGDMITEHWDVGQKVPENPKIIIRCFKKLLKVEKNLD